jgi:hypothetical protein
MDKKLTSRDVDIVSGDLIVAIPDDGIVLVSGDDVLKLAAEKGRPLPEVRDENDS